MNEPLPSIREEYEDKLPMLQEALTSFLSGVGVKRQDLPDVLQNTLFQATQNLDALKHRSKLLPWMKAIARNQAYRLFSKRRMQALPEAVGDSLQPSAAPRSLSESLSAILPVLTNVQAKQEHKIFLALHLLGWSLQDIDAHYAEKINTIRSALSRMKKKIKTVSLQADDTSLEQLELSLVILRDLFTAGVNPIKGAEWYNQPLCQELHERCKTLSDLHPQHAGAAARASITAFSLGQLAEFEDDTMMIGSIETWRRHKWDRHYIETGVNYYHRTLKCQPDEPLQLEAEFYYLVFSAPSHEEVLWEKVLTVLQRRIQLDPKTNDYLEAARIIRILHGPLEAAKYLESHRNNKMLITNRAYFYYLGLCYYKAEDWRKARTMLKKCLAWTFNKEFEEMIEEAIDICSDNIQKSKP